MSAAPRVRPCSERNYLDRRFLESKTWSYLVTLPVAGEAKIAAVWKYIAYSAEGNNIYVFGQNISLFYKAVSTTRLL